MEKLQILDERIIEEQGSFKRVRWFIQGHHPELGRLHFGWSGKETIIEKDVITPIKKFEVKQG